MNRINLMFSLRQGLTMCGRAPTAPAHKKQWNVDVSALARFSFVAITVSCAPIDLTAQSSPAAAHPVVSTAAQPAASVTTDSVADDQTLRHVHQHIEADGVQSADATFDPGWWQPLVSQPIRPEDSSAGLTLDDTLLRALEHSRQIQVFRDLPLIRETTIIEADAAFDWTAFTEARWDDTTDPIGNSLTAGGDVQFFEDHRLSARAGLRRRTRSGADLELFQRLGFQDNNSQFFVPDPQGTARLNLSFTQPLMRGRGRQYNESLVVLAQIDKNVAEDEVQRQLQSHLLEVARSYWALFLERAVLYQKINSYIRGKDVFDRLNQRREVDARLTQIISAEATLKSRASELVRARAAVKNAESRLRSLVNDPSLCDVEIIPIDMPVFESLPVELDESITIAFQKRPELKQAIKNIKAAAVRLQMAKHELLPVLDLVTNFYLSGLEGQGQAFDAWANQFDTGRPSYGFGLEYELPILNRAANARHRRRQLEIRQLRNQYATTLETVRFEVEVAARECRTSQTELSTKQHAMQARAAQLNALTKRWQQLPGEDVTASLALENLLIAQDALADAEFEYLQSQLTFKLSIFNFKRATGTLMESRPIEVCPTDLENVPVTQTHQPEPDSDKPQPESDTLPSYISEMQATEPRTPATRQNNADQVDHEQPWYRISGMR
ncbi:TolC family protein [Stieleria sp. ICT_E10.1]|uniref:TolC family protein n=1 Tax=Stieleria sedimenti TaxID=2976331 RepID=UPI00217F31C3|nr:TolC family protein [Stieleria sedimenti]MCS7466250.1 TolC family protein [Stieleria sedimenti]